MPNNSNIRQNIIDALIASDGDFLGSLKPATFTKRKQGGYYIIRASDSTDSEQNKISVSKIVLRPLQSQSLKEDQDFPAIFVSIDHAPRSNANAELGYTDESLNMLLEISLHNEIGPPNYNDLDADGNALSTLPLTSQITLMMHQLDDILMPSRLGAIDPCIDDSQSGIVAFLTAPLADNPNGRAQQGEKLTCHVRFVFTFPITEGV